jgi:hypothetical protein
MLVLRTLTLQQAAIRVQELVELLGTLHKNGVKQLLGALGDPNAHDQRKETKGRKESGPCKLSLEFGHLGGLIHGRVCSVHSHAHPEISQGDRAMTINRQEDAIKVGGDG